MSRCVDLFHLDRPNRARSGVLSRRLLCGLLVLIWCSMSCVTVREDFGHGFKVVRKRVRSESSFERYAYYDFLRYRGRDLGEVGEVSVSPGGRYVLFEQDGKLMLFDATSNTLTDVTGGPFAVPKKIEWDEPQGFVLVTYPERTEPKRISLQPR